MILIIGTTKDDINYFEAQLKNKKEVMENNHIKVLLGDIFNQSVCLAYDVYSNIMSSAVVTYLIKKYDILAVFNVGSCHAFSDDLKAGDIVVSDVVLLGDVNLELIAKVKRGEIPGFNEGYVADSVFVNYIIEFAKDFMYGNVHNATFISCNKEFLNKDDINDIKDDKVVMGKDTNIVFESTSGGCAFASKMFDVPFISVKIVMEKIKSNITTQEMIKTIKESSKVGKLVAATIAEIGRNDTIIDPDYQN